MHPLVLSITAGILANAISKVLLDEYKWAKPFDKHKVSSALENQLSNLNPEEGLLVGYVELSGPDDDTSWVGPFPLGEGENAPEVYGSTFSRKGVEKQFEQGILDDLGQPGFEVVGSKHYWVTKDSKGGYDLAHLDGSKLQTQAWVQRVRSIGRAIQADAASGLEKIVKHERLFNGLEKKYQDEINKANALQKMQNARRKMAVASNEFSEAVKMRNQALDRMNDLDALSVVSQLLQIASTVDGMMTETKADINYQQTVINNSSTQYNLNVNIYQDIWIKNIKLDPNLLPTNPTLEDKKAREFPRG